MQKIKNNLAQKGYHIGLSLNQYELGIISKLIHKQYSKVLEQQKISNIEEFRNLSLQNYHTFSHTIEHGKIWNVANRILDSTAYSLIRKMTFFKNLESIFGKFKVSGEFFDREEFMFRICRPNQTEDIGPLHADAWFWELNGHELPKNTEDVYVWIPIYVEKGLNGFRYVPYSHKKEIPYRKVQRGFSPYPAPQIEIEEKELDIQLFCSDPGEIILFHRKLIHGGALNKGLYTRVSLEFTMLTSKK